jgi:hypothetical protein
MPLQLVKVLDCEVTDCAYNANKGCHTAAITVGSDHPACDTFLKAPQKGGAMDTTGGVGACKVDTCTYNSALECTASGIHVRVHGGHADCATFSHR